MNQHKPNKIPKPTDSLPKNKNNKQTKKNNNKRTKKKQQQQKSKLGIRVPILERMLLSLQLHLWIVFCRQSSTSFTESTSFLLTKIKACIFATRSPILMTRKIEIKIYSEKKPECVQAGKPEREI